MHTNLPTVLATEVIQSVMSVRPFVFKLSDIRPCFACLLVMTIDRPGLKIKVVVRVVVRVSKDGDAVGWTSSFERNQFF